MQALNGDPGADGIGTLPPHSFPHAHGDDRSMQIGGLDGPSTEIVLWRPGERSEPAGQGQTARLTGPVQFLSKLLEHWRLDPGQAVGLLGFDRSDAEYVRSLLAGRERLRGRDVRDRIACLYGIRKSLRFLFRDLETENAWLREPHELLDDESPMDLVLGGSMENLLIVRDYVDTLAGR